MRFQIWFTLTFLGVIFLVCGCGSNSGKELLGDWVCTKSSYVGCNISQQDKIFVVNWQVADQENTVPTTLSKGILSSNGSPLPMTIFFDRKKNILCANVQGVSFELAKGKVQEYVSEDKKRSILNGLTHQIQNGINCFEADTGCFPCELADVYRPVTNPPKYGIYKSSKTEIPSDTYCGPYSHLAKSTLRNGVPKNPFVDPNDEVVKHHWNYNSQTGEVTSAVSF